MPDDKLLNTVLKPSEEEFAKLMAEAQKQKTQLDELMRSIDTTKKE